MNERITEQIVRKHLDRCISEDNASGTEYWEQSYPSPRIGKLLTGASKTGGSGKGRPEFIITFNSRPEFLIVIECKADERKHQSRNRDKPKDYAVDGVLHYAKHLKKEYNVLAIAVSGNKKSTLRISHFFHFKEESEAEKVSGDKLLKLENYIQKYLEHKKVFSQDFNSLLSFTKTINTNLHKLKIPAPNRSLLISAILTALEDKSFKTAYGEFENPRHLLRDIKLRTLESMKKIVKPDVLKSIKTEYGFMDSPPNPILEGRILIDLVKDIDDRINSFRKTHQFHDFLGQFYIAFLRYSNSEKQLGIVLTPPHITDLAARLVEVRKKDVVYDNCAGTGGFLISSMQRMIEDAEGDNEAIKKIKNKGIVGTEIQPSKAALLCSNMFIHKDGRSNFIFGNCFDDKVQAEAKKHRPTIGLLNPPFKAEKDDDEELAFVLNNLQTLQPGGKCVAILPMQCATAQKRRKYLLKKKLLEDHTLEAVLSLPDQIFHNSKVNAVVCMMLFTAHQPHSKNKKTWFGYCKDDGFVIRKHKERVDYNNEWESIRDNWVQCFTNKEERKGLSIMREVSADDEWCAEAYMETDYSKLTKEDFEASIKEYIAFKVTNG